ncbi:MAG: CoA pyrophosphatase [Chromatiales bacterium]|nr:CoA pyrophosphatase [Chromatiales bacterium]
MIDRLIISLRESRPPVDLPREALARLPGGSAGQLFPDPLVPAAVLVGLAHREAGWEVLLTRRTEQLRDHPGQISLPGGRLEAHDEGPRAAALREAREEVGIGPEFIDVVGYLPPHPVVTGFAVSPVVALLRPGFTLQADPAEVAEIFAVPLEHLLDPANFIAGERRVRGITLPVYTCQFGSHLIWGATAHILHSLGEIIHAADQ